MTSCTTYRHGDPPPTAQAPRPPRTPTKLTTAACQTLTTLQTNHAKNYAVVPLAVASSRDTTATLFEVAGGEAQAARDGAQLLGLLNGTALTPAGRALRDAVIDAHGCIESGLTVFEDLYGRQTRLIDACPAVAKPLWEGITTHPALAALLEILSSHGPVQLPALYSACRYSQVGVLQAALIAPSTPPPADAGDPTETAFYASGTISHLKSVLYHAGVLTERGKTTDSHDPCSDMWALEPAFQRWFDGR